MKMMKSFAESLIKELSKIDSTSIAFHTDMVNLNFIQPKIPIPQQFNDLFALLMGKTEGRDLLFPTFNYDFLKTGIYNVSSDPCQVGVFNEHIRKKHPDKRTFTPVFNYCIPNNGLYSLSEVSNPFSTNSIFDQMVKLNATIVFLGTDYSVNTFGHFIEEIANIGYRYKKKFKGTIVSSSGSKFIELIYRVRPQVEGAVAYDIKKVQNDLVENKLLFVSKDIKFMHLKVKNLSEFILNKLYDDELYLLTPESQAKTKMLYSKYGKPLTYEVMEKNKE